MGVMIEGRYVAEDPGPDTQAGGRYERAKAPLRDRIGGPETGRYHLFAAWNCPWAHRVLLGRAVLGLEDAIGVSYALPRRTEDGWVFAPGDEPLFGAAALHGVYARHPGGYTGRVTVPLLWDTREERGISNESADILRMPTTIWDADRRLCPKGLEPEIDAWNAALHRDVTPASTGPGSPARKRPTTKRCAPSSMRSTGSRRI
ncbi:MAG: hypothetical protein ACU0CO_00845 [Shimia sp.]